MPNLILLLIHEHNSILQNKYTYEISFINFDFKMLNGISQMFGCEHLYNTVKIASLGNQLTELLNVKALNDILNVQSAITIYYYLFHFH